MQEGFRGNARAGCKQCSFRLRRLGTGCLGLIIRGRISWGLGEL